MSEETEVTEEGAEVDLEGVTEGDTMLAEEELKAARDKEEAKDRI
jgi:hypothetical protein